VGRLNARGARRNLGGKEGASSRWRWMESRPVGASLGLSVSQAPLYARVLDRHLDPLELSGPILNARARIASSVLRMFARGTPWNASRDRALMTANQSTMGVPHHDVPIGVGDSPRFPGSPPRPVQRDGNPGRLKSHLMCGPASRAREFTRGI